MARHSVKGLTIWCAPPDGRPGRAAASWKLALQADRKSAQTIDSYTTGVRLFLEWCANSRKQAELDRTLVRSWVTDLLNGGAAPATARSRQMALKRYSAWLVEEGE